MEEQMFYYIREFKVNSNTSVKKESMNTFCTIIEISFGFLSYANKIKSYY